MQVSRPETLLKRDFSTGIFLCNFSKNLIYRTPPDDFSYWFIRSDQGFIIWWQFFRFFFIDNCNYGNLFKKGIKMKVFFTIYIYPKINMNVVNKFRIQISLGKSLGNCRVPREISKAEILKLKNKIQLTWPLYEDESTNKH